MKVIIAGSRDIISYTEVCKAIAESGFVITEVVSGKARGVDRLGEIYATISGIPLNGFPADWDLYGKSAGYRRNEDMGEYADALILIWDGVSDGSGHMLDIAKDRNLQIHERIVSLKL